MSDRLTSLFSSPRFKNGRVNSVENLPANVSPLLSTSTYNSTQDELSLEMDARSEGLTSRICDTANHLLLGEFPWGCEKQNECINLKQKRVLKPVPVRLRIGPPNSSSLLLSDVDNSEYENEECNSSKTLIHALRELSRKRSHSFMNEESEIDSEVESAAAPKKHCKPIEHRHNLYLSQLEEETQEYKNGLKNQSEHTERNKRLREDDSIALIGRGSQIMGFSNVRQDGTHNFKRQRMRPPEERNVVIPENDRSNGYHKINGKASLSSREPRRGSNEILSSLSSSLTLLDPAVLYSILKPRTKEKRKKHRKAVAVETQTVPTIVEETSKTITTETSPKKEDKSINTDPEKPAIVQEKVVTDKMANALMKSAVSKFLATEDPTLSPIRNPSPSTNVEQLLSTPLIEETLQPSPQTLPSTSSLQPSISAPSFSPPSFSLPTTEKPSPAFTFGSSSSSSHTVPSTTPSNTVSPFTFGSPPNTTASFPITSSFPTMGSSSQSLTNKTESPKPTDTVKQVSFGDNTTLDGGFKTIESQPNLKTETKNSQAVNANLFSNVSNTTTSSQTVPSDTGKSLFSFTPISSTAASTPSVTVASSEQLASKTPSFTFGSANSGLAKLTPSFDSGTVSDTPKSAIGPPKLSMFNAAATTVASASTEMATSPVITATSINHNPVAQKSEKLFGFSAVPPPTTTALSATITAPTTENKPFSFGGSQTKKSELSQTPQQPAKPLFQFGSSSFGSSQPNKEGFTFGTKPTDSAPPPAFGSSSGSLFSAKPSNTSTPTTTAAATTSSSIFGFGSVQPASSTARPTFGSITTTTNSAMGSFSQSKTQDKPSNDAFAFKFAGGTSAPTAEASKPSFTFGASSAQSTAPVFGSNSISAQPNFGNTVPSGSSTFSAFGSSTPAFGSSAGTAAPSVFGSSNLAPTFGAPATPAQPAPAFGAPATTAQPAPAFGAPAIPAQPAPAFGVPATSVQPAPTFGAPATPAQPAPTFGAPATPAPTFGAPATPAQPPPTFGATATPAQPASTFGSSTPGTQPVPSIFGSIQTQPTQGPSFTFGASSAPNPTGGFNFGAAVQQPAPPNSSGMFQFGSSATQQNQAGGAQPFQFGAAASNTSTPGFGFSPSMGGFNPGVSGGQPMFSIGSGSTAPRTKQPFGRRKK